jgi:hypothetical protein
VVVATCLGLRRWHCGMPIAAGWERLYGPAGPGVHLMLCPVDECLSAVEVGHSHVVAGLFSRLDDVLCFLLADRLLVSRSGR